MNSIQVILTFMTNIQLRQKIENCVPQVLSKTEAINHRLKATRLEIQIKVAQMQLDDTTENK